ncbi:MAG: Crp/Fnr family transcriptional regulator [Arcicella sp.]|jgi:CRP-like cAMP-binding protein|nr:Crp/Fnr family transcriptional regulator [Arcicella sp.]
MNYQESLKSFFKQFDILTDTEIGIIMEGLTHRTIRKGEYFIGEGVISREFAFVKNGFFRHYIREVSGEEKTYRITFPHQMIAAYSSLVSGIETKECIEAITDADLIVLSLDFLENNLGNNINWVKFSKAMVKIEYIELEKRVFSLLNETPKQRYLNLLEQKPHYLQQIPLKYLSSYLGISQRHLTRLRKEVTL